MKTTVWKFNTARYSVALLATVTGFPEGMEAAEYLFEVTITHRASGAVLGADYLGESVWDDPAGFRAPGGYLRDMVRAAVFQARAAIADIRGA